MLEIIDLSQDIFPGMPVFTGLPEVEMTIHASHEQWEGITDSDVVSPAVNRLTLGELATGNFEQIVAAEFPNDANSNFADIRLHL
ncbi:MAG: hypothetical protein MI924_20270, partial [Chloroflexales bacterium]|nr:hypothetical protein [Chloroflexales bacterium]